MGKRTIVGELAQMKGMITPIRQGQNRINHLFKKVEDRVRKGKNPYKSNDIKGMIQTLNSIPTASEALDILEGKTINAPKEKKGFCAELNKDLTIALNAMTRAHETILNLLSDAEKETYFTMSENCNEVFDIMQKADKPEVVMNVVRNFSK